MKLIIGERFTENISLKSDNEIQEEVVHTALIKCNCENAKESLYDVTYDIIYKIMEQIDGHTKDNLQLDIIEKKQKIPEGKYSIT